MRNENLDFSCCFCVFACPRGPRAIRWPLRRCRFIRDLYAFITHHSPESGAQRVITKNIHSVTTSSVSASSWSRLLRRSGQEVGVSSEFILKLVEPPYPRVVHPSVYSRSDLRLHTWYTRTLYGCTLAVSDETGRVKTAFKLWGVSGVCTRLTCPIC